MMRGVLLRVLWTIRQVSFTGILLGVACARPAHAVDENQVYNAGIAAPGQFTVQQHLNYIGLGLKDPPFPGELVSNHRVNSTPEFAYDLTDWWEVGLYPPFAIHDKQSRSDSFKLRTLFVTPQVEQKNFFYIDIGFGKYDQADFAPAAKLARKLDQELYVGLEYCADFGEFGHFGKLSGQQRTLFAVSDFKIGVVDVNFGVDYGLTPASDRLVVKDILGYAVSVFG